MPSSPTYVRDIKQEEKTAKARGDNVRNKLRHRARRLLMKAGLVHPNDGKDVNHIQALKEGGAPTSRGNLNVETEHQNRSFPRRPDGSMIVNHEKTKG